MNELTYTDPDYWKTWRPDAVHINALPEGVRRFIHALEIRADPAGDTRTIYELREQNLAMQKLIEELRGKIQRLKRKR